jgi:MFS transporter, PAT family, beta-lactamase induction signal transducer AmpG
MTYTRPRVLVLLPLGFASGLPYLLVGSTLQAWLARAGAPLSVLGLLALVALPYSLKLAWAPLLDRFRVPLLGRRRGWMLVLQVALALAVAGLGALDATRPRAVAAGAALVAFLSASFDVVADAYRADLLAPDERAAGAATFVFGYRAAMMLTGGAALVAAEHWPWRAVYAAAGAVLLVSTAATALAPEPAAARAPRTLREAVFEPFFAFGRRPGAGWLLAVIACYRLGDLVANNMVTPFLLDARYAQATVGEVYKIMGTAATVVGALAGGAIVARVGLWRALVAFGGAQAVSACGYALLARAAASSSLAAASSSLAAASSSLAAASSSVAAAPPPVAYLVAAVGTEQLCAGLQIAALEALLLSVCDRRYSATQLALLTSVAGLAARVASAGGGYAASALGWPAFFAACAALALPALALLVTQRRAIEPATVTVTETETETVTETETETETGTRRGHS